MSEERDIVERLRSVTWANEMQEAASEIQRLRGEVERLRGAIRSNITDLEYAEAYANAGSPRKADLTAAVERNRALLNVTPAYSVEHLEDALITFADSGYQRWALDQAREVLSRLQFATDAKAFNASRDAGLAAIDSALKS